ncbi:SDR family NAD(P)-dependent oxidoreductase [Nocardia rhizosphaerihabitans]|uniref:3-oxoacyl-[acyl-carrier-protein] reductase MabA n=1 Tax=Nocardia rhizosphaerihabitans TaxID=1691570 RepID=A0ABQ2K671_9NOCA|nr:SDR family oxidoreductase [Nocardia rhizosphaerihabitans]GGN71999.1 short-chain dehydrogenase [Nocardia rhizosphaerihabitans]
MTADAKGRLVVVTGAGSGIGRASTLRLLADGASVVATSRSSEGLKQTAELAALAGFGSALTTAVLDVSDEAEVEHVVGEAISYLGGLDVVVNAAGILRGSHTHEVTVAAWNETIAINLTGTFLVTRTALPALLSSGNAVVINIGSTAASSAHPYMAAYAASKGGMQAFTRTLALEYSKQGLRAVCLLPGGIETKLTLTPDFPADVDRALLTKLRPAIGGGELGAPERVAEVVALLASPASTFITGTEISIDGGAHM